MSPRLRNFIRLRANGSCEYCQLREYDTALPHEVDHVRARKHRGGSQAENLAFSCAYYNAAKGPNVAGHDPATDELVSLFNPRIQKWSEHFRWRGAFLEGKSPVGRATIDVLRINAPERIQHRQLLSR